MTLEAFARSCGVKDISKSCFPYEYFKDPNELKACFYFPAYRHFRTVLSKSSPKFVEEFSRLVQAKISVENWDLQDIRRFYNLEDIAGFEIIDGILKISDADSLAAQLHTSPEKYEASAQTFTENCSNMMDYLESYNLLDCELLMKSIQNYAAGFQEDWNINIHDSMSLPGFAEKLCYRFYDDLSPSIFTFGKSFREFNNEIRKNLNGGMTMVLHRHASLGPIEEDKPREVFFTDSGEKYKRVESFGSFSK